MAETPPNIPPEGADSEKPVANERSNNSMMRLAELFVERYAAGQARILAGRIRNEDEAADALSRLNVTTSLVIVNVTTLGAYTTLGAVEALSDLATGFVAGGVS